MLVFNWVYVLLMTNLGFTLTNGLFLLAILFLAIDIQNVMVFSLSLLFVGPAVITLIATINQYKEINDEQGMNNNNKPVKMFLKNIQYFGLRGFIYWLIGWAGTIIGVLDILFFINFSLGKLIIPFFGLLIVFAISTSINSWYFQVMNPKSSIKDILRVSIYFAVRKWYISLVNVPLFVLMFFLMLSRPQFGFIITPSLLTGLIYLNSKKYFKFDLNAD